MNGETSRCEAGYGEHTDHRKAKDDSPDATLGEDVDDAWPRTVADHAGFTYREGDVESAPQYTVDGHRFR
jgi:hypothetical protein